jgi:hypothetical protein
MAMPFDASMAAHGDDATRRFNDTRCRDGDMQTSWDRHCRASAFPGSAPFIDEERRVTNFFDTLAQQRYDDHRYYHHSRINQSLHLVSAVTFIASYALLFVQPAMAAILAWCVSMTSRQTGHFFFEPRGYDHVNDATDDYKEEIKVGYNIKRKIVLLAVWVAIPMLLWFQPSLFGLIEPFDGMAGYFNDIGLAWLALGAGGLLFRGVQLTTQQSPLTAIAWMTKIVTDPFHDVGLYWKAPFALMRGELIDPMLHIRAEQRAALESGAQDLAEHAAADASGR